MRIRDYQPERDDQRIDLTLSTALGAYDPRPAQQATDIHYLRGMRHLRAAYDDRGRVVVVDGPRREVLDHLRGHGFTFCCDRP